MLEILRIHEDKITIPDTTERVEFTTRQVVALEEEITKRGEMNVIISDLDYKVFSFNDFKCLLNLHNIKVYVKKRK